MKNNPPNTIKKVGIIGAGPSGLVTAKYALAQGFTVTILETSNRVGGVFGKQAGYEDGALVSSKYLTAFSDFRSGKEDATHLSFVDYERYLQDYALKFDLVKCIKFGCAVSCVDQKNEDGTTGFIVTWTKESDNEEQTTTTTTCVEEFDAVAVCSGAHSIPLIPHKSLQNYGGQILHASQYKHKSQLHNKRVLIVGSQETSMDISHHAVISGSTEVAMVVRRGFLSVPHELHGKPLDCLITNAFESCWQHVWVEKLRLKWWISTFFIRVGFWIGGGSSWGWNQWCGRVKCVRRGYNYITKATAVMPFLNAQHKQHSSWWRFAHLWSHLDVCDDGTPLPPQPQQQPHNQQVVSRVDLYRTGEWHAIGNNTKTINLQSLDPAYDLLPKDDPRPPLKRDFDLVVLCTGYRQTFPFLEKGNARPSPPPTSTSSCVDPTTEQEWNKRDYHLPVEHFITDPLLPTLGFIGFVRPNVGAIPPMAELQAMWWIARITNSLKNGPNARGRWGHNIYKIVNAKHQYSVDYGLYMHELARDLGSLPSPWVLLKRGGIRVFWTYSMGQAFVSHFRLIGLYAWDGAWEVAKGELYDTVQDRGYTANFVFGVMNVWLACVNLCFWLVDVGVYRPLLGVWWLFRLVGNLVWNLIGLNMMDKGKKMA